MVKRLLHALGYPEPDSVNTKDEKTYRKLIAWVEQNKINKANPETLKVLCDISSSGWKSTFNKYKLFLGCPESLSTDEECIQWILGYAIQLEHRKNKDVYLQHAVENIKITNVPSIVAENPLDKLDFSSNKFEEGITNIAKILKITPHPNAITTLKAVEQLISKRLTPHALENPNQYIIKGTPYPFEEVDLGFELNDPVLRRAAKMLRMLYIQDLRNLQTKANELIAAVQTVTANPKTDTRLGKVGMK